MLLLLITLAQAKPLSSAEFEDTAHTMKPGQKQIDLLRASQYAVTDELELSTSLLGLLGGPNIGVEYALQEGKSGALSLRAGATSGWLLGSQSLSGGVNWTKGGPLKNRVNLSGGLSVGSSKANTGSSTERTTVLSSDLYGSYHLVTSKQTTWRFYANTDPLNSVRAKSFVGGGGFDWNHGWDKARVSLGMRLVSKATVQALVPNQDLSNLPAVVPVPTADLWFTW